MRRRKPDALDRERIKLGYFLDAGKTLIELKSDFCTQGMCLPIPCGDLWPGSCEFPTELLQWGMVSMCVDMRDMRIRKNLIKISELAHLCSQKN